MADAEKTVERENDKGVLTAEVVQVASDAAQDKKILFKIDIVVLTLVTLVATFEFLDKNGMAYAAVWGMKKDAKLVGQQYSWLGRWVHHRHKQLVLTAIASSTLGQLCRSHVRDCTNPL